jgi:hypothetical protein
MPPALVPATVALPALLTLPPALLTLPPLFPLPAEVEALPAAPAVGVCGLTQTPLVHV